MKKHALLLLVVALFAFALSGLEILTAVAQSADTPSLFTVADSQNPELDNPEPTIIRSRFVSIDVDLLGGYANEVPVPHSREIVLNLFADTAVTAVLDRVEPVAYGGYAWMGHVENSPQGSVVFVVKKDLLVGSVRFPSGNYQIRPAGSRYVIHQLDDAAVPEEEDDGVPVYLAPETVAVPQAPADDGSLIDVMVVYTPVARQAVGGQTAMEALINLGIVETNTSYANSNVNQRVRLVHRAEVSYTESGSSSTDLTRLRSKTDGYLDEVHPWRDLYGADIVSLWLELPGSACGRGYIMTSVSTSFESSAFNVTDHSCATGYFSFGHEMGHNMGMRHDWYVDSTAYSPYSYNHGYTYNTGSWRTVMAYGTNCSDQGGSCTRIAYWSNPNVLLSGVPMGVAAGTSTSCSTGVFNPGCDADNHLALDNTAFTVANFRQTTIIAELIKSAPAVVDVGNQLTYTLVVSNNTPLSADNVLLTDTVPANTILDVSSLSPDATYTGVGPGSIITWNTGQSVPQDQSLTRSFVVTTTAAGVIANTGYVSATNTTLARASNSVATTIREAASCGLVEGFETGALGYYWETHATNDGRIRVLTDLPRTGTYHAVMDDSVGDSTASEAAMILNINLAGTDGADLDFYWYDLGDEYHAAYDGVFIRENAADSWHKVFDFAGSNTTSYQYGQVDLAAAATGNGITLTRQFQVKFQGYDNFYFIPSNIAGGDGYSIDDLQISCTCSATPAAPVPTITAKGSTNIFLSWVDNQSVARYEVWSSLTPYFAPNDSGTQKESDATLTTYTDYGALADGTNHFYLVRAQNGCGVPSATSGEVGKFEFTITPGS